ncbi:MAG: DUF5615 family PIN-like protein [Acidimicrobiales bacterium]
MKLLLDANLSPRVVDRLAAAGFETVHVHSIGLLRASDEQIFDYAIQHEHVVVTADTDFPMMLALRRSAGPSVILLRGVAELEPAVLASLIAENVAAVADQLEQGAVVSLSPTSMRWRQLPLEPPNP